MSLGTWVTVEERSDSKVVVNIDGTDSEAQVTRRVVDQIAPDRGFDITVENQLPVGQGFGMSASGAIAAAMALCDITGRSMIEAYEFAHIAEVMEGGGLGDVSAISCSGHQPVRVKAGLPPYGKVIDTGIRLDLTLAVTGTKLNTESVIRDSTILLRMAEIGSRMVDDYSRNPTVESLFSFSREFSSSIGLESEDVKNALDSITPYAPAGMCMLGHSIFTTAPEDLVREKQGDVPIFSASTSDKPAFIQRE